MPGALTGSIILALEHHGQVERAFMRVGSSKWIGFALPEAITKTYESSLGHHPECNTLWYMKLYKTQYSCLGVHFY